MVYRLSVSLAAIVLLPVCQLKAQEDSLARPIDEVVVSATRTRTNRNNVPMAVSVVNRSEIEESSESALLPVLSGRVPGMFVTQRGVAGFGVGSTGSGSMTLRGVGVGNELLVLVDGHPQYMGIMGHHIADAYVASDVEKVEVVRGPASLLYGSNAMGGVVNIITRRQDTEGWQAGGRLMYGSYNTQKYQANAGVKSGKLSAFLSLNHDRTEGHRENTWDDNRRNAQFHITNGYTKLSYQINRHFTLWGDVNLAQFETTSPGPLSAPLKSNIADIMRGIASVSLENTYDRSEGTFKFFYNFGRHKIDDGYGANEAPKDFFFRSTDHNYGITWYQVFRLFEGNSLTAGYDFKNFGGCACNDYHDSRPDMVWADTSLFEMAGYIVMQHTFRSRLTLNAGLRLDYSEQYGRQWVPQAGVAYRPWAATVFKASVSKGFRNPNIQDLYYLAGWAGHNPNLRPETMMNYEVSIGQTMADGRLTMELTGFFAKGSNIIVSDFSNGFPPTKRNSGSFENSGVEFEFRWDVCKTILISGNYSYLHMETPIAYSPEQQAYLAAVWRRGKWGVSANFHYVHRLHNNADDLNMTTGYALLDARVSYRPLHRLELFVKGENLTNCAYQTRFDYPMPGITAFGGLSILFNKKSK